MKKIELIDPSIMKENLKKEIDGMVIPTPSISVEFTMMQKLFSYWVKKKHYYGNWSGTGVGKTYSFILASRMIDAHLTVVIGTNSTTHQLKGEICGLYNDSVAVVYDGTLPKLDMTKHNYLILNYEKGQQKDSMDLFNSILEKYKVDYIVFDEVQNVKQRGKASIRRNNFLEFRNKAVEMYDSYVSVLTATPYTTSIFEVISLLTLMTGDDYKNIKTKNSLKNTIAVENLLNSLGVNASTESKNIYGRVIEENIHNDEVIGDEATFNSFKENLDKGPLAIYQSILKAKLEYLYREDKIKKGEFSILYTQFTSGIVDETKDFFNSLGFKVCEYTGSNKDTAPYTKDGKVDWKKVKDNYDILLTSSSMAEGVDGLQKVCNKMSILNLPWTHAKYRQLVGRIWRKKSIYDKVDICIPMVRFPQINMVGYDDKVWNSIVNKGVYSDACLKGKLPMEDTTIHGSIIKEIKGMMAKEYVYAA